MPTPSVRGEVGYTPPLHTAQMMRPVSQITTHVPPSAVRPPVGLTAPAAPKVAEATVSVGDATLKRPYNPRTVRSDLEATYGAHNIEAATVPASNAKNVKLAGQRHPETGIVFSERGFPIFDDIAVFDTIIPREVALSKLPHRDVLHKKAATEKLAEAINRGDVPSGSFTAEQIRAINKHRAQIPGYTWHHNEMTGRMQLIPREIHQKTGHIGGMETWIDEVLK